MESIIWSSLFWQDYFRLCPKSMENLVLVNLRWSFSCLPLESTWNMGIPGRGTWLQGGTSRSRKSWYRKVPVSVPEKFGICCGEFSGISIFFCGTRKFWYQKKYRIGYPKNSVPKISTCTSIDNEFRYTQSDHMTLVLNLIIYNWSLDAQASLAPTLVR